MMFFNTKLKKLSQNYNRQRYQTIEFLRIASKKMPKLSHLELHCIDLSASTDSTIVNFDTVTKLDIRLRNDSQAIPLSFTKLNELKMWGFMKPESTMLNFIIQMNSLTKLDYNPTRAYGHKIDDDLNKIADKLNQLQDVIIHEYDGTFNSKALKQFVLKCKCLRKLCVRFYYGIVPHRELLTTQMASDLPDWNVFRSANGNFQYLNIERIEN